MVSLLALAFALTAMAASQESRSEGPEEADYYRIVTLELPEELVLEISAITVLPDGRPMIGTRRGDIFIVENAYQAEDRVEFKKFTDGLHEPMGLLVHGGWIYVGQRGELSRMRDVDGDDRVDEIETVCDAWRLSGNYHEYLFGPALDPDGNLWITTNKPFGDEPFGRVDWRGFALRITPEGEMIPTCCGLRSPAGVGVSPWGDVFYTDNQGEWCGASKLSRLIPGSFHGHPWGLPSCEREEWPYEIPSDPADGTLMPKVADEIPSFELPAVWFPYDKMGRSPAGFVWDRSEGAFGPFSGQLFVSDQYSAAVMRVVLEEIEGHWQGACIPFREGFQCGIVRICFAPDASLLVGMTNRGWGGRGNSTYGMQRLVWTGETPFEIQRMSAIPDGFELHFTTAVEPESAAKPGSYLMESYTYELHQAYGSDEMNTEKLTIQSAVVSDDGLTVRLKLDGLRAGYVHELHLPGLRSRAGQPLLHPEAYYTLIRAPKTP